MAISTKDFDTLISEQATAIQGAAKKLVDLTIGSILRALIEANTAVILWLQGLIIQLLSTTRAASSTGDDLDSWVADYGVTRLSAKVATGFVTFARFTPDPTNITPIPVGSEIQTNDGLQNYKVGTPAILPTSPSVLDTSDQANQLRATLTAIKNSYQADASGATQGYYRLAAGQTSLVLPIQATVAGTGANVSANTITTIKGSLAGIDTVTNTAALTNGTDAETDAALRTRFISYIASLSKATKDSVGFAISSLSTDLSYTIIENTNYDGSERLGYFYVVVDDGTGSPSDTLLASVYNAIDAVRPVSTVFGVFKPILITVNLNLTLTVAVGYDKAALSTQVSSNLNTYINSLGLGEALTYTRLAQVVYDTSVGITNVSSILLNSGTSDVSANNKQVIKAGTITIA
jgi:uncharacterized phage protein gp47/JayE